MTCYVYIMASFKRVLYTGVTGNIERRVFEHQQRKTESFSEHYKTQFLVYAEPFGDIRAAIAREKQIKGWLRRRKVALIESSNPSWKDLSAGWFPRSRPAAPTGPRRGVAQLPLNGDTHREAEGAIPNGSTINPRGKILRPTNRGSE